MLTSSAMSNLADGVLKVALPLVAIQLTRDPTVIAGLSIALTLPWLLFALPAGALSDRLDRRNVMLGANLVRGAAVVVLAVAAATGLGSIGVLYALALVIGVAETLYDTSAQSIVPQLVGRDLLPRANSRLYAAELTANEFVGPPLAGLVVAVGAALAFAVPAALWLCAFGVLLIVRGRFRIPRAEPTSMRADIAEGLRFLWRNRVLRTLAVMVGVMNFASSATWTVFVLYAVGPESEMGLSEQAYGVLFASTAVGALVGSFLAAPVQRALGRSGALTAVLFTSALYVSAPAATTNPYVIAVVFFVGGVGIMVWNVIAVTLRQRISPDRLLGRVNSAFRLLAWGTIPLGALAAGLLAETFGLAVVFAAMGVLTIALVGLLPLVTNSRIEAAEREAST